MESPGGLPLSLRDKAVAELNKGEKILWLARPAASRMALRSLPLLLLGIPWTLFTLFWMGAAAGPWLVGGKAMGGAWWGPLVLSLFGLPFLLVGFAMLISPIWAVRKARRTLYVITGRRAMIIAGGRRPNVTSFGPELLRNMELRERSGGSGDIIFERKLPSDGVAGRTDGEAGFIAVAGVRDAEELLRAVVALDPEERAERQ